jgi:hypothetical protein
MSLPPRTFAPSRDRTVHWTISLYVDERNPANVYGGRYQSYASEIVERVEAYQGAGLVGRNTRQLRDAIEPLFNDIADRWQLRDRREYLVASQSNHALREVFIDPPSRIEWATEGRRFFVEPAGLAERRSCRLRTFWFVHNNGAISYHLAFASEYADSLSDYYFLSLLQKLCAPKEMERHEGSGGATAPGMTCSARAPAWACSTTRNSR